MLYFIAGVIVGAALATARFRIPRVGGWIMAIGGLVLLGGLFAWSTTSGAAGQVLFGTCAGIGIAVVFYWFVTRRRDLNVR